MITGRVEFDNVSKFYGEVLGINRVSLSIEPGITSLVGPNGSGKTTLMNVMTGLLHPTKGTVHVLGYPPSDPLYAGAVQILMDNYTMHIGARANATNSMRSTFALACESPSRRRSGTRPVPPPNAPARRQRRARGLPRAAGQKRRTPCPPLGAA